MSRIFKRPKSFLNQGSVEARNVKSARTIKTQAQLDSILAQAPTLEIAEGWIKAYGGHLPFIPRQLQESNIGIAEPESAQP